MRPLRLTSVLFALLSLLAADARAGTGATIASTALANVGKGACSTNTTGGTAFDSSCTGNGGQPEYWCADFVRWVWADAGVDTSTLDAAAGSFYVYGVNNNTLHYPPSVGDAVVFDYSGDGIANHVAIVVQVNSDDSIETVSGDWGGEGATEAAFSSSSAVVENTPAYASTVGTVPEIMGMTISGFISPVGGPPPCTDACLDSARVGIAGAPTGSGYWIADAAGHVYPNGNASFFGDLTGVSLAQPVVGIAATPSGQGYWMVAADGGVFAFGDATYHGSEGGSPLNKPMVGMASTPTGAGYWLVAADGGIFSFGDAVFHGSAGGTTLNAAVVGMAATPTGGGYWLVAGDGGIFSYGDAAFEGSAGATKLNAPVVGMAVTASGAGYWLVAADGGIFAYGDAAFDGSAGSTSLNAPIVGMATTPGQGGYWLVGSDGGIFTYGNAAYDGNALGYTCSGNTPVECVVASSKCTVTQNAAACAAGQVCAHGTCQTTCTDACTTGTSRCSGAQIELCGHYSGEPCNSWSPAAACPSGQSCSAGVCASPTCSDVCEPGATECKGGMLVTCSAETSGGCHTWGTPTACQYGQTCEAGGCVTVPDGGVVSSSSAGSASGSSGSGSTSDPASKGSGTESGKGSSASSKGTSKGVGSAASSSQEAQTFGDGGTRDGELGNAPGTSSGCAAARDRSPGSLWSAGTLVGFVAMGLRRRRRGRPPSASAARGR